MRILDFFKTTSDDWSPNYPGNLVSVVMSKSKGYNHLYVFEDIFIINVSGKDDIYMTKSFTIDEEKEAYNCIVSLLKTSIITFDYLESIGFES